MPPSGVDYASEFLNGYAPEYVLSALAAYCCFPKKPCIKVRRTYDIQPSLF